MVKQVNLSNLGLTIYFISQIKIENKSIEANPAVLNSISARNLVFLICVTLRVWKKFLEIKTAYFDVLAAVKTNLFSCRTSARGRHGKGRALIKLAKVCV